jgi:hypothetical protein
VEQNRQAVWVKTLATISFFPSVKSEQELRGEHRCAHACDGDSAGMLLAVTTRAWRAASGQADARPHDHLTGSGSARIRRADHRRRLQRP